MAKLMLNDAMIDKMVNLIRDNNYYNVVCEACGISETTFYSWLKQGEEVKKRLNGREPKTERDRLFLKYFESIKKAEADAEAELLKIIKAHSFENWQAAAWILERKHFTRWGRKDRLELQGNKEQPIQTVNTINLKDLTDEQLELAERLARSIADHKSDGVQD